MARGLRSEGYEVDTCADAHAGLKAAQAVIVLSCLSDSRTKVQCFQLGADDYVAKPFSFHELLERVKARIRTARQGTGPLEVGSLRVDLVRRQVQVGNQPVALTEREFLLLWELMQRPGETVSKEQLLASVWGYKFDPGSNVIDVYVARLRQKLGPDAIVTIRGEGYRLNAA